METLESGVIPFTSDSSTSSSEANIPTLPAVWLKQQEAHLASSPQGNKSGCLPRSFQVGVQQELLCPVAGGSSLIQLRSRPVTIASDKLQPSDVNCGEVEVIMDNFHEDMNCRNDNIHSASSIDKCHRSSRSSRNRDLYLSYMDNGNSDSDGSADSFYERSFEAIESLLESELFTDDIQTSESEFQSDSSTKANSSLNLLEESPINVARRRFFSSACSNSISILAARLNNSKIPFGCTNSGKDDSMTESNRKSRLVRSHGILEKLKNLERSSQFHKEDHLTSAPSFEGIKSI
jgi:hypothetical protein